MGFYTEALAKNKAIGKQEKAIRVAVNALKKGKLNVEEIAELVETDLDFVLSIEAKVKKGLTAADIIQDTFGDARQ